MLLQQLFLNVFRGHRSSQDTSNISGSITTSNQKLNQYNNQKPKIAKRVRGKKKKCYQAGKNAENAFHESSSQERLTVEATNFNFF